MNRNEEMRLQSWISSGQVSVPQLFFKYYKKLNITDEEMILLLQLQSYISNGIDFPPHTELAARMEIPEHQIMYCLQGLLRKGLIHIKQEVNQNQVLFEKINLMPLWMKLMDCEQNISIQKEEKNEQLEEGKLFQMFEQEFGRLLSPIEIETITMWIDEDHHDIHLIKQALKEAVLNEKMNLKYIDRILFEWKKKNITTSKEAVEQSKKFREHNMKSISQEPVDEAPVKKAPFYNWLEERE